MDIGFVGLGKMGAGIAGNLLKGGHRLTVYNRTRQKAEELAAQGARVVDSPAEAARGVEAVFTMLADDHAVKEAVFGGRGIASTLPPGAAHISSSTISTGLARKLASEHSALKQVYLAAPVFGRPEAAAAAKLIVIASGEKTAMERYRTVFDSIGRLTLIVGEEPWQANAVKLCGNFMIASMLESFAEAFAVIRKAQIEEHHFLSAMTELFGSPVYKNYGSAIAEKKFEPAGFALKLGLKDVKLALELSDDLHAPMPVASLIRDSFISALANGQESMDWSSLALVAARNAGL